MNPKDCHFLLLTGKLGDPNRNPLTPSQLRKLSQRALLLADFEQDALLTPEHLHRIGVEPGLSEKILHLLGEEIQLDAYLARAKKCGCWPITRSSEDYPLILRKRLGADCPGCLWTKGNRGILKMPAVSLVGSRNLKTQNRRFAQEVGRQAAKQGFALVSGNARGSDVAAQDACLGAGGRVISIVADTLADYPFRDNVLYISEEDFDAAFSPQRALHRNFLIHTLGEAVFVAQCGWKKGGTWKGSYANLKKMWSPLYCFLDDSDACRELELLGAELITIEDLEDFYGLSQAQQSFF